MPAPKKVNSSWFMVHRKTTNYELPTMNYKVKRGFTLIELLVVIAIFALTTGLITASYTSFEKNRKVSSAAATLKEDLRATQNKALSGDKGSISNSCNPIDKSTLVGWYLQISANGISYTINNDCLDQNGAERLQTVKPVSLPTGVKIASLVCGVATLSTGNILYQPLTQNVAIFRDAVAPPFLDRGKLKSPTCTSDLFIKLTLIADPQTVQSVVVKPSGAVQQQ